MPAARRAHHSCHQRRASRAGVFSYRVTFSSHDGGPNINVLEGTDPFCYRCKEACLIILCDFLFFHSFIFYHTFCTKIFFSIYSVLHFHFPPSPLCNAYSLTISLSLDLIHYPYFSLFVPSHTEYLHRIPTSLL